MNIRSIGCVELNSVAMGMVAADEMVKSSDVSLVLSRPTCPGRYLIIVAGDTAAVENSVQKGREVSGPMLVDHFTIANLHPDVFPALSGTSILPVINALGVIETYTVASCILAADAAAKSGTVSLIEIRFASGLAGKSYVTMTGDVSSVKSSVEAGIAGVGDSGPVFSHAVIASPSEDFKSQFV